MLGDVWSAVQSFFSAALISISDYSFVIVVLILAASAALLIGWTLRLAFIYLKHMVKRVVLEVSLIWRRFRRGNKMSILERELVSRLRREELKYKFKSQFMADKVVDKLEDAYFEGRISYEQKQLVYNVLAEGFDIPDLLPRHMMRTKARIKARLKILGIKNREDIKKVEPYALPDRMHGGGVFEVQPAPPKNRLAGLFTRKQAA